MGLSSDPDSETLNFPVGGGTLLHRLPPLGRRSTLLDFRARQTPCRPVCTLVPPSWPASLTSSPHGLNPKRVPKSWPWRYSLQGLEFPPPGIHTVRPHLLVSQPKWHLLVRAPCCSF